MNKLLNIVILNDTRSEHHHGCSRVMNCIDFYLKGRCADISYSPVGDNWQTNEKLKQKIINSDIVIVNGEGTIHHNSSTGLALIKVAKFAKNYGVKSYLINTTYQENDSLYNQYLLDFEQIFVRESYSKKELLSQNINSTIVPDLTFSFIPHNTVQISGSNTNTAPITKLAHNLVTDSGSYTNALTDKFKNINTIVFSSVFNQNITAHPRISMLTRVINIFKNNNIAALFNKLTLAISNKVNNKDNITWVNQYTHTEYADFLSQAKIVICGRFHAMTICMNHGTPFLAIESNSHKVSGTLTDIGLDKTRFLVTPEQLTIDHISTFELTKAELQLIKEYADNAKVKISNMFEQKGVY